MDDTIVLTVGGRRHTGAEAITVSRSLDAITGSFTLTLAARGRAIDPVFPVVAGDRCTLSLGGETVIDGWIDAVEPSISESTHLLTVSGRDRTADLADCSAIHRPGSWRNQSIERIAADLTAPFGVSVKAVASTGGPIRFFALQQGETVQAAIERLLRFRGLLMQADAAGNLEIVKADEGASVASLRWGVNISTISARQDHRDRFSDYLVKGQARGGDDRNGKAAAQVKGDASDSRIARYRPILIVAEDQVDSASATARAEFEAGVRAGRSRSCEVTVLGWRIASGGALWRPNRRVRLTCSQAGFDDEVLLIEGVEFSRTDEGTLTRLSLVPGDAWRQLPDAGAIK